MGKGDKKSKRGKIILGSYGVRRPRKKNIRTAANPVPAAGEQVRTITTGERSEKHSGVEKPARKKATLNDTKPVKEKAEKTENKAEKTEKETKAAKETKPKKEKQG